MGVCILSLAIFKNVFDVGLPVYNFSVVSNLFNSNKPYVLSTHNRKRANKVHHIGEALRIRFKNLNTICLKIIQKALK